MGRVRAEWQIPRLPGREDLADLTLLAVDPATRATGYAVFHGPRELLELGVIRSSKPDAQRRIDEICDELEKVLGDHHPDYAVVETSAAHQHGRFGDGGMAGLARYGEAVGAVRATLRIRLGADRVAWSSPGWTRRTGKRMRVLQVAAAFPDYVVDRDRGADAADAAGLGMWWFAQCRARAASTA